MNTTLSENDLRAIQDVLIQQLTVSREQLLPGATIMGDLGADSLDVVEICMLLEERFNLTIPDEKMEEARTVEELCDTMAGLLGQTERV